MPIALLLQETVLAFRFGAKKFEPWPHMVTAEELLLDRARSAFLVHWFGKHLPLRGSYLKVVVENLKDLRYQYLLAGKSARPELSGPNLIEPLAGAAGILAGAILSPTGTILLLTAAIRKMSTWVQVLLGVLGSILLPPLAPLIWIGVGLYIELKPGPSGPPSRSGIGDFIEVLGTLALLLNAARGFLEQLLGPREKVANPLLRQILGVFDRLAGLVPHVLGFIAIVITRVGPYLYPIARQINAFRAVLSAVMDTLSYIANDLADHFMEFLDPKYSLWTVFEVIIDAVVGLFPALISTLAAFFDSASDALIGLFKAILGDTPVIRPGLAGIFDLFAYMITGKTGVGFSGLIDTYTEWLTNAINGNPLMLNITAAKLAFGTASEALTGPSKGGGSTFPSFQLPPIKDVKKDAGGEPLLGFGDIKWLGNLDFKINELLLGSPPRLSPGAEKQLERARHPVSVFGLEEKDLEKSLGGKKPSDVLAEQLVAQQKLRDLITDVVGRVLPPEMRLYLERVVGSFAKLDEKVYAQKISQPDFPVRDLPDNGLLQKVVHRLIVRSRGGDELDVQDFGRRVRGALIGQRYPAPVGT